MLEIGILKSFDGTAYTAEVQLASSITTYFGAVPVARNITSGDMVAGRHVIIVAPDDNPADTVLIAVFTP